MKRKLSLSTIISIWTGVAGLISIGICLLARVMLLGDKPDVSRLFDHDSLHIILTVLIMYGICLFGMRRFIIKPLSTLYIHLYEVAKGHPQRLDLDSSIKELDLIEDSVNTMVHVMKTRDSQ